MIKDFGKIFFYLLAVVAIFLLVIVPIFTLILTSFTGEPIPLLDCILAGEHFDFSLSWKYYVELFLTRRYRQGFINSLGMAPTLALLAFFLGWLINKFTRWQLKLGKVAFYVVVIVLIYCVSWRWLVGEDYQRDFFMRWLVPGKDWTRRFMQGIGLVPLVTILASMLGTSVAFCFSEQIWGKRYARVASVMPLALPSFLGALAFKNLWGINGIFTKCFGPIFEAQSVAATVFLQVFLYFPFVMLTVSAGLERYGSTLREASATLGAGRLLNFFKVDLPILWPSISAGAILVFIRSLSDFSALSLLLPMNYPILIVEAYRDLSGSTYWGGACMLSVVAIIAVLSILGVQKYTLDNYHYETILARAGRANQKTSTKINWFSTLWVWSVISVPIFFVLVSFIVSIAGNWGIEVLPTSYTLDRYKEIYHVFVQGDSPLINSLILCSISTLIALFISFIVAYISVRAKGWKRHVLDYLTNLPFIVPSIALAIALICTFNGPPLILHLTATLVICAYVMTSMPYGTRSLSASLLQIDKSLEESSFTLGADKFLTTCKILWPLIRPGLITSTIMIFIACIQETAITLMICPPEWKTAAVYIFIEIQEGNVFNASAYGMVIMGIIFVTLGFNNVKSRESSQK